MLRKVYVALRLFALMMIGAFFGFACIGQLLVSSIYGYDHGFGEGERCAAAGALIGAFAGLGLHLQFGRSRPS